MPAATPLPTRSDDASATQRITRPQLESAERVAQLRVLRALADPMRLEIVAQMATREETPCTLLEALLPVSKSTISYHIKNLYVADLVTIRKEGRFYFYGLREDVLDEILPGFLERLGSA